MGKWIISLQFQKFSSLEINVYLSYVQIFFYSFIFYNFYFILIFLFISLTKYFIFFVKKTSTSVFGCIGMKTGLCTCVLPRSHICCFHTSVSTWLQCSLDVTNCFSCGPESHSGCGACAQSLRTALLATLLCKGDHSHYAVMGVPVSGPLEQTLSFSELLS